MGNKRVKGEHTGGIVTLPKSICSRKQLPPNTQHRNGSIFRRDFKRRCTVLSLDVVTQELCLTSCINKGAP